MPELLHDPRFIGPLVTSFGVIVSLTLWLLSLKRKELSFEILSQVPLLSGLEDIEERPKLTFDGKVVTDLHLVTLRVSNSGNVAVRSNEYEGKLTILFPGETQVLTADVLETQPDNLAERSVKDGELKSLIYSAERSEVVLRPVLMNRSDYITVKILVNRPEGEAEVLAHIEGIHQPRRIKGNRALPLVLTDVGAIIMPLAFARSFFPFRQSLSSIFPFLSIFLVGCLLLFCGLYARSGNREVFRKILKAPREIAMRLGTHH